MARTTGPKAHHLRRDHLLRHSVTVMFPLSTPFSLSPRVLCVLTWLEYYQETVSPPPMTSPLDATPFLSFRRDNRTVGESIGFTLSNVRVRRLVWFGNPIPHLLLHWRFVCIGPFPLFPTLKGGLRSTLLYSCGHAFHVLKIHPINSGLFEVFPA